MVLRPTTCSAPAPRTSWQLRELKCCNRKKTSRFLINLDFQSVNFTKTEAKKHTPHICIYSPNTSLFLRHLWHYPLASHWTVVMATLFWWTGLGHPCSPWTGLTDALACLWWWMGCRSHTDSIPERSGSAAKRFWTNRKEIFKTNLLWLLHSVHVLRLSMDKKV